jgi:hypothetical protein
MIRLSTQHATVERALERKSLYCTLIFALCGIHVSRDESNVPAISYGESFVMLVLTSFGKNENPDQALAILINPLYLVNYM